MSDQCSLFSVVETRSYFDALARHEKFYSAPRHWRQKSDDALREKVRLKEERDARCQRFFEAMLRPPQRAGR